MTNGVFQLAIAIGDGWLKTHLPPYMPYLWGACALLWVWWGIAKYLSSRSTAAPSALTGNSGNQVGRDNLGRLIQVAGDYHEAPAPQPYTPIDTYTSPPKRPRLEVNIASASMIFREEKGAWVLAQTYDQVSRDGIIVRFKNPVAPVNSDGVDASALSAHIKYSVPGHWECEIARAYWLNWSTNQIEIEVGHTEDLVLGLVDWSKWVNYENPYSESMGQGIIPEIVREKGPKKEMPEADMDIDISLLLNGRKTIDEVKIHLTFAARFPYAVIVP